MKFLVTAALLIFSNNSFAQLDPCEYDIRNAIQIIESHTSLSASTPIKIDFSFSSPPYKTQSGDVVMHFSGTSK